MQYAMKYMVVLSCVIILLFVNDIVVCAVCGNIRERRQAAAAQEPDYTGDYAGNENYKKDEDTKAGYNSPDAGTADNVDDTPTESAANVDDTPKDNVDDAPKDPPQDDKADYGGDDFTAPAPKKTHSTEERSAEDRSAELKKIKKAKKRSKFVKDVIQYLKKVLAPQNLMQNQWVTEMLRKFSNSADDDYKSAESVEEQTLKPSKRRRGRPRGRRSRKKMPTGLKGLIAYGLRTVTEIDSRKLRRNLRYVRRIARKAKKPLKAAVKLLLSTQPNTGGLGGGGGGGYGNTY